MSPFRRRAAGLALATTLVVSAACGDDGDTEAEPPADNPPTTPGDEDTTTPAADAEIDEAALQALLDQWRIDGGAYGATLSIRVPGHDDIHLASGVDDRDVTATAPDGTTTEHSETPMPTDGVFPVGAVTQTFVAATALQLVDEGQLSLDEPVAEWLPELPNADEITLRMLLDYTSGLANWADDDYANTLLADLIRSFTPDEVYTAYLAYPPVAEPGEELAFGGVGSVATGMLIERLLGQDLASVIAERFTTPLALDDTTFADSNATLTRHGWLNFPGTPDQDRTTDILGCTCEAVSTTKWAESNMVSSSADMLAWGEALFTGDVLGEESTATLLDMNPAQPPPVPDRYFAVGTTGYCAEPGCGPDEVDLVGAPGSQFEGWSTQLAHHLASGTTIVVHANTNSPTLAALKDLPIAVVQELGLG